MLDAIEDSAFVAEITVSGEGYAPGVPIVDLDKDPGLWAIIDTACNSSVVSEGWIKKIANNLHKYGLGGKWLHRVNRNSGGSAGAKIAKMVGRIT